MLLNCGFVMEKAVFVALALRWWSSGDIPKQT